MRRGLRRLYRFLTGDFPTGTAVAQDLRVGSVQAPPGRRDAGVTLVEALVVLAILGLVAAIVTVPVNSYWQRSRLQSAAGDIRSFLQMAYTEAANQHAEVTVTLQHDTATGRWQLQLNPPPAAPRPSTGTFVIPEFVSLAYNPAATAGGWPATGTARSLACTPGGLTMIPSGSTAVGTGEIAGSQARQVKTLSISHTSMVDGSLAPNTRFDIQVYPIWSASYRKVLL